MELLFARNELNEKPKKVKIEKIIEELKELGEKIFYFDKDNSHKDMMALVDALEGEGYNVYFREVRYGLADEEYMYEVHAL
ncbi:HP0268 family nuclease [Arcobacter sp.]|uniref:HP0268 family nuclease n=1 Tax=Arcobacter sp. TaxID=1872629 RepID=UPI003D0F5926